MKYIDSEKLKAEIKKRINELDHDKYLSVDSKTARIAELHFIDRSIDSLQQEQPVQINTLTWKDINDLERIINNVHYEFRNGIGEKSFGEEVLERFREENDLITDIRSPKFNIGDKICSKDGQYHDEVVSVNSDGSYKLKILGELFLPEEEWKLEYERNDGFELIERNTKKQPDVDLEKEIAIYFQGFWPGMKTPEARNHQLVLTTSAIMELIEYFFKLGLNARKEN